MFISKSKPNIFKNFTKKYSLSKTLRFELKPLPETEKYLDKFIDLDAQRNKDYQELKKIIDDYHREYIEKYLSKNSILKISDLKKLDKLQAELTSKDIDIKKKIKTDIDSIKKTLRKQVKDIFLENEKLFKKELVKELLPKWLDEQILSLEKGSTEYLKKEEDKKTVEKFKKWTTYLTGFHKNRENMYTDKDQGTAISHRIIDENFFRFRFNMSSYRKIKNFSDLEEKLNGIREDLKEEFSYFNLEKIEDFFKIEFFNKCLNQKGIDNYNTIIGGKALEGGRKIQGINEKINIYCQQNNKKLPRFQFLYKQILSKKESHSFLFSSSSFESNKDLLDEIKKFSNLILNIESNKIKEISKLFEEIPYEDDVLSKIYFAKSKLSDLSQDKFKDWHFISDSLEHYAKFEKKSEKGKWLKKDFFNFKEIHDALICYNKSLGDTDFKISENKNILLDYFQNIDQNFKLEIEKKLQNKELKNQKFYKNIIESIKGKQTSLDVIKVFYNEVKYILENPPEKKFQEKQIENIKIFLDSLMIFFHILKPVYLEKDKKKVESLEKHTFFYNEFEILYDELSSIIPLYNKTRNYIAQNKNHLKKIKINFENCQSLDGWDVNKEIDNRSIILRKKENGFWIYYLGIIKEESKDLFDYVINFDDETEKKENKTKKENLMSKIFAKDKEEYYEKMVYKLLPSPSKMFPKVFFSKKRKNYFNPSKNILRVKNEKTYAKNDGKDFNLEDCHQFIDFYKESIRKHYDWKQFDFKFSPTEDYNDISDFYHEVSSQGYKLKFDKIKSDYIQEKLKEGKLYLFKIYNKDFSNFSKGRANLHTTYFNLLFEERNLKDIIFKMNGQAEIFYRKASQVKNITHKKNVPIKNKNKDNPREKSTFNYDLVKNKRFTEDKFFFHLPIDLNFKSRKKSKFNQEVLASLKDNKNVNILGIDRGERHLAYYTIINQNAEILKQESFNIIENQYKSNDKTIKMKTDYHRLLENKEKERDSSRKSWVSIKNIKELKSGYLSHLVHKISQLMIEHNAILVFENLNFGFKKGRMKFEKQVYQKLEKALIDKLNYLIFKNINDYKKPGGYLNAYQLTDSFVSFEKIGNQTGFIFYVPANYTSKVDPLTGFVNLIYPKYESIKKSQDYFKKFNKIYFDSKNNYFAFEYQDKNINFGKELKSESEWKICTHGNVRYVYSQNSKRNEPINVTEKIKELFKKNKIDFKEKENLVTDIYSKDEKEFFSSLTYYLKITLQLRYTNPQAQDDSEKDFILSPVATLDGKFFDSRKVKNNELPKNADANGAYHIALKGLKILQDLSSDNPSPDSDLKVKSIKNKEWFKFIQKKSFLRKSKKIKSVS